MISPTLCFPVTPIKRVFAFPEWLMYWTYLSPPRRAIMQKGMGAKSIHIYSDTYSMIFHVCDHQETYGTYYKKWRLEVTATLGKFKIALLSRWVKNSWSIQKGSIWGAQVFHCEKMFTATKCTNTSLLDVWDACICVATHTVQEAKADCRNRIFLLSILNLPQYPNPHQFSLSLGARFLISIQQGEKESSSCAV